jgi:outer membrane biosynthesis protein TonB
MANNQQKRQNKILRVGIIQNGRVIEERLIRERETVTVGTKLKNTLVVASDSFPDSTELFALKGDRYVLQFTDQMQGRIALGDGVHDLRSLVQSGKAKKSGNLYTLPLSDRSRGKIGADDITVLFQFVTPPPLRVLPQLPANMRGGLFFFLSNVAGLNKEFVGALLFSAALQIGLVLYLRYFVPPPARGDFGQELAERWVRFNPEEPEQDQTETEVDPNAEGEVIQEEEPEEIADEPSPGESAESDSTTTGSDSENIGEVTRETVVKESPLAALYNDDGGMDLGIDTSDTMTQARVEEAMAQSNLGSSDGPTSSQVSGTSGGAERNVGREEVGSGGPSEVAQQAQTEEATTSGAAAVSANVRGSQARTGGGGRLDQENLQRTLRRKQRDVQRCYERALASNPNLGGRLIIQFTIGQGGVVTNASLPTNQLGSAVGNCVIGKVRRWRFDSPEGGSVTVQQAYILQSQGG